MSSNDRSRERGVGAVLLGMLLGAAGSAASAAVDLAALQVLPQRGQSADQLRRDRYECHNWAVEQSGVVPRAPVARPAAEEKSNDGERRTERVNRTIGGAAIGAAIGSLIHGDHDWNSGRNVLAGAAVGAAVGAATTPAKDGDNKAAKAAGSAAKPTPGENDYLRALSACMEGRGYRVVLPGEASDSAAADSS